MVSILHTSWLIIASRSTPKIDRGKIGRFARYPLSLILYVLISPQPAYAYLELGTGSYLTQLVIASFLGGLLAVKIYWRKFTSYLTNLFTKKKVNEQRERQ